MSSESFQLGLFLFVLFASIKARADEQDSFYFDPSPVDQEVNEGGEVRLRCDVSNRRMISFYWTLNGKQLTSTSRRFQEDSDLRILKVDRNLDSGSFRCVATNISTGMALRSTEARLNIFWIDSRAEIQSKAVREGFVLNSTEGSEVNMKCQAEGNPEPAVEWFHNKMRISPSDRLRMHKNRLRISSVSDQDTGVYTCKARNVGGLRESSNSVVLLLQGNPEDLRLKTESFVPHLLVREGSSGRLSCQYLNSMTTEWYFNDTRISGISGKYLVTEDGGLEIQDVEQADSGSYKCVGRSSDGVQKQTYASEVVLAHLDDLEDESFEPSRMSTPVVIPAGGKLEVMCHQPKGLPAPSLRWVKKRVPKIDDEDNDDDNNNNNNNNSPIVELNNNSDKLKSMDGLLSLSNVDESITGTYLCVVENLAGVRNKTLDVVVSVPPTIQRPPMSVRVTEEESATFECRVTGTPYPVTKISWLFDDEPIDMSTKDGEYDESQGILKLNKVTLNDVGSYACVANTSGHQPVISTNAHLYVEKRLKFRPPPSNARLELDTDGTLECRADGKSQPRIRWMRNNTSTFFIPLLSDRVMERDGMLYFRKVEKTDAGNYTCVAESDQGSINATINVVVYVRPRFKVRPNNMTLMEGQKQLMLHCVTTGDPQPLVQWNKNGFNLDAKESPRFKVLQNGSLVISEVYMEDNGKYSCTAENVGGLERTEVHLHVATAENYHKLMSKDKGSTDGSHGMMRTIVIAVSCGLAYLALVIGLTVYCTMKVTRSKQLKKHGKPNEAADAGTENALGENAGLVPKKELEVSSSVSTSSYNTRVNMEDYNTLATLRGASHINLLSPVLHQSILPHRSQDRLYLPRHKLQMLGMLGRSHYGDVFLARTDFGGPGNLVIVKSFLSKTDLNAEQCLREVDLLGKCNHNNVAKLVGLCADLDPLFVVVEHFEWGDLKKFLVASRDGLVPRLTHSQMAVICGKVALGMEHIADNNIVHRDLAARNIIICPNSMEVKISCPFLCRDVYAQDYFLLHDRLIPLRWMAPEAILDGTETKESDVWSYGVFVWEVFSLGEIPLSFKTNEQVLEGLNSRENKLPHPSLHPVATGRCDSISYMDCPENMWRIIQACTMENPRSRPRFSDLVSSIYDLTYETVITKSDSFVVS